MSDKFSDDDRQIERVTTGGLAQQAASSTYKVLGQFAAASGAGVLGENTADSGTPIGVEGAVPNSADGFGLSTPDDARVGGRLDTDSISDNGSGSVSLGDTLDLGGNTLTDVTGTLTIEGSADNGVTINTGGASRTLDLGVPETDGFDTAGGNVVAGHPNNAVNGGAVGSVVGGGGNSGSDNENTVEDHYGVVGGGEANQAGSTSGSDASHATVGGGGANAASGLYGTVGGGQSNTASGQYATVAGGEDNTASGNDSNVGGGQGNTAGDFVATVAGGYQNSVSAPNGTVAGGQSNDASDIGATVGGGFSNAAGGQSSTVPGGDGNTADGDYSFAAGNSADTNGNHGAFVWGDSSATAVTATAADEVRFQATGGFVVAPESDRTNMLDVQDKDGNSVLNVDTLNGVLALNGNDINEVASIDNGAGTVTVDSDVTVTPFAESNTTLDVQDSGGNSLLAADTNNHEVQVFDGDESGSVDISHGGINGSIATSTGNLRLNPSGDIDATGSVTRLQNGSGTTLPGTSTNGQLRLFDDTDAADPSGRLQFQANGTTFTVNADAGQTYRDEVAFAEAMGQEPIGPDETLCFVSGESFEVGDAMIQHVDQRVDAEETDDYDEIHTVPIHLDSGLEQSDLFAACRDRIDDLEAETAALREENADLRAENEQFRERNAELEDRLATIERELGLDADGCQPATADD